MSKIKIYFLLFFVTIIFTSKASSTKTYFMEAKKLFDEKKYLESKFKFEKDIVFNPKNEKSYLYLARIFNTEKNDVMEEQNLNTVILLNPKNEEAVFLLALLKIKKSDYTGSDELIKTFEKICIKTCERQTELKIKFKDLEPK